MSNDPAPQTWPELAEGLYARLTGRGAEISYAFSDMVVEVPSGVGEDSSRAAWKLNGTVRITTSESGSPR